MVGGWAAELRGPKPSEPPIHAGLSGDRAWLLVPQLCLQALAHPYFPSPHIPTSHN